MERGAEESGMRGGEDRGRPQVKVCGLTRVDEALQCAELGVDAIGCVFYPKSPRNVTDAQAREICSALPGSVRKVGLFVDEAFSDIMRKVETCRLSAVQLHGHESPELVDRLCREELLVIKGLFMERDPSVEAASDFRASAFLVECGKGVLPGGNAIGWDWGSARSFGEKYPLILAGGLTPENVSEAVAAASPDAVDVSSGVESSPGRKDAAKVAAFVRAARGRDPDDEPTKREPRVIF